MSSSHPEYSGMTVNERLFAAGLIEAFDSAIDAGDRQAAIDVLSQVCVGGAAESVDMVLANPAFYGYPRTPHVP